MLELGQPLSHNRWRRRPWLWILVLGVCSVAAAMLWREIQNYLLFFGLYHDDAVYMVLGKALAEGRGYELISLPGDIPETKYPIGFPLVIALLWKLFPVFPDNLLAIEIGQSIIAVSAVAAVAAYLYKTGRVSLLLALTIASATILNSTFLDVAPMILSDYSCLLWSMLALWLTERVVRKGSDYRMALWLGALLALPALMRWQGLAALLAAISFLWYHRRYRFGLQVLGSCLLILLPQIIWVASKQNAVPNFLSYYASYFPSMPDVELSPGKFFQLFMRSFFWNSSLQLAGSFPILPAQYRPSVIGTHMLVHSLACCLLGIVALIGIVRELRRASLPLVYCLFYASPIFIFPVMLEPRQLAPMLPLTYYVFFCGFRTLAFWLKRVIPLRRSLYRACCCAAAVGFATYLIVGSTWLSFAKTATYAQAGDPNIPSYLPPAKHSEYQQAVSWIKAHSGNSDTLIGNNDALLFLYTGRQAMQPWRIDLFYAVRKRQPYVSPLEAIKYSKAKYVVDDPMFREFGRTASPVSWLVATLHARYPGSVVPVFSTSGGVVHIFAVDTRWLPVRPERN